jgi:hypothetical protein
LEKLGHMGGFLLESVYLMNDRYATVDEVRGPHLIAVIRICKSLIMGFQHMKLIFFDPNNILTMFLMLRLHISLVCSLSIIIVSFVGFKYFAEH